MKWSGRDQWKLMEYAETMSQRQAAEALGRSVESVESKVRWEGYRWRGGLVGTAELARRVGCSQTTVATACKAAGIKSIGEGTGRRYLMTEDEAERVEQTLTRQLRYNSQNVQAGRARACAKK